MVLADDCLQAATTEAENVIDIYHKEENLNQIVYRNIKRNEAGQDLAKGSCMHQFQRMAYCGMKMNMRGWGKVNYLKSRMYCRYEHCQRHWTQALSALTSNFGCIGLVKYA